MSRFLINSRKRCVSYRKRLLEISQNISALHIGGSFSCTEILDVLYNKIMTSREKKYFIMSKGHASIMQYVILEAQHVLKKKDLDNYCKKKGFLGVHPDIGNPGINASTGSLGHGLAMSAGIAMIRKKYNDNIYILISDGELQEGSTWESILLIPSLNLYNIVVIIDNNDLQSIERTSVTHKNLYPIEEKFSSFGWHTKKCNGHNSVELYNCITKKKKNKPLAIIAKTIKGYPISFMKNKPIWHYKSPNKAEFNLAIKELNNMNNS
jgi:transketolase